MTKKILDEHQIAVDAWANRDKKLVSNTSNLYEPLLDDEGRVIGSIPLKQITLTRASNVTIKPIDWLWAGYLPRGMLTLLAGLPGCGKSTLALALAATVTSAGRWPDGAPMREAGDVLVWSSEDAVDTTLAPRLAACGANLNRVHFVEGVTDDRGERRSFDPSTDIGLLTERVESMPHVKLLILDPILCAVSGDSHKAAETRRGLQAVVDIAAQKNIAVLGITHFSKGSAGASPAERVIGSQAFVALARMVLIAAKVQAESEDQTTPPQRIIVRAKSNISADDGGFSFNLELVEVQRDIVAQRVTWGEAIKGSALALLNSAEATDDEATALDDACEFLRTQLANGPVLTKTVEREAKNAGISKATLRRAREKVKVKSANSLEGWTIRLRSIAESAFSPGDELAHDYRPEQHAQVAQVERDDIEFESENVQNGELEHVAQLAHPGELEQVRSSSIKTEVEV